MKRELKLIKVVIQKNRFALKANLTLATAFLLLSALSAETPRTWTVDDDRAQHASADFATLSEAVDAAGAGDRIVVYPGVYDANLVVGKALVLAGPKSGLDARTRPVNEREEAILQATSGQRLVFGANDIVLDGFLVRIPTSLEAEPPGVFLDPNSSGCEIINNLFDQSGLEANSRGPKSTFISRNRFESNGDFFGLHCESAAGITVEDCDFINAPVWFGVSDGVVISMSTFSGPALRDETATLHLRRCLAPLVQNNTFTGNANLGLTELEGGSVKANTFRGGGIWITLANRDLIVERNQIGQCGIGIRLQNEGPGPSGAVVRFNEIAGNDFGVLLSGDAYANLIQGNNISNNRIGIQVSSPAEAFSDFNMIRSNNLLGNSEFDCVDMTTGSGTAGTANLWRANNGSGTSSPPGLCKGN